MNIQEMKEKKKEMGYTNEQIAELSEYHSERCRRFLEGQQPHRAMIH